MNYSVYNRSGVLVAAFSCPQCAGGLCECVHDALTHGRAAGIGHRVYAPDGTLLARIEKGGTTAASEVQAAHRAARVPRKVAA